MVYAPDSIFGLPSSLNCNAVSKFQRTTGIVFNRTVGGDLIILTRLNLCSSLKLQGLDLVRIKKSSCMPPRLFLNFVIKAQYTENPILLI
jgi:hypothetical protein